MGIRTSAVLLSILLGAPTLTAQPSILQQASSAFHSAQQADKALNEKPQSDQTRSAVLKVINAYQNVYLITPKTSYADDALVAIARLYESIKDNNNAVKTLNFLVREYPQSPFRESAKRDITRLSSNSATIVSATVPATLDTKLDATPDTVTEAKPETKTVAKSNPRPDPKPGAKVTVDNIRYWEAEKSLRVVVDLSGEVRFKQGEARSPDRVFIDIANAHLNPALVAKEWPVQSGLLQKIRVGQFDTGTVRVVLDVGTMLRATSFTLRDPDRLIIDVVGVNEPAEPAPVAPPSRRTITESIAPAAPVVPAPAPAASASRRTVTESAPPPVTPVAPAPAVAAVPASVTTPAAAAEIKATDLGPQMASAAQAPNQGNRSLIRSLGLKISRVVIDAGHGGHDTGSIGPTGFTEKELVLDVAKRLKSLIENELGAEVVMTRSDDTFVPLETRTAIANQQEADLFISIHANSSKIKTVRGVETFFLNFTTSRDALDTASRENAASDRSIHDLGDLVKKIVLRDKVDESREFAQRVQTAMSKSKDNSRDRGVKQAPFVVLIGANMPSILAEVSFISNPDEEKQLKTPQYRQQIAESLLNGVRSYADTLSGVKTAKSIEKN